MPNDLVLAGASIQFCQKAETFLLSGPSLLRAFNRKVRRENVTAGPATINN